MAVWATRGDAPRRRKFRKKSSFEGLWREGRKESSVLSVWVLSPVGRAWRGQSTMVYVLPKIIEQETLSQRVDVIFFSRTRDQIWESKFPNGSFIRVTRQSTRARTWVCIS